MAAKDQNQTNLSLFCQKERAWSSTRKRSGTSTNFSFEGNKRYESMAPKFTCGIIRRPLRGKPRSHADLAVGTASARRALPLATKASPPWH